MKKIGLIKNLIIDTDMGWDDVLAILLLIKNPNYKILGITVTGCGETHLEKGVELALQLATLGNQPGIVVCAGANKPGQYDHQFPESFRDRMDEACGLKSKLPKALSIKDKRYAWDFINDCLREQENQITILSLGGLTNIQPLLEMNPRPNLENIERIVIMGGAIHVDGNVAALNNSNPIWDQGIIYSTNDYAEWNIFLDPRAAQITFNSGIPIKLVPLDACDDAILDKSYSELVTGNDAVANFVRDLLNAENGAESTPLPVFDPLAAIEMTNGLIKSTSQKLRIGVNTVDTPQDNTCGQTYISKDKNIPEIEVVMGISSDEFKKVFQEAVNSPLCPLPNENVSANIAILVFDEVEMQDFAGAFEVFSSARNDDNSAVFNVFTVAVDKSPKTCNSGVTASGKASSYFKITPDYDLENHPDINVLYIIGGPGLDAVIQNEEMNPILLNWIATVSLSARFVAGTCSGAILLAHSKQLKNMDVTTHHSRFGEMAAISDKYKLNLQVLDTRNGEQYIHHAASKFMTSGGVTCGLALSLHIVELYQGLNRKETLAKEVLEYTIPRGSSHPVFFSSNHMDPSNFILGFSHLNIIVADIQMMDDATNFYKRTLGFRESWSVCLSPESCEHFARDAGFSDGKGKVIVRFLVHPNAQFHLELMYYEYPKGNQEISFHKTNDVGGIRHVALEVDDILKVYAWLKNQDGVQMLSDTSPERLTPDPQTFFYWIDPYGVQWEMEEGRPMARVINGIIG